MKDQDAEEILIKKSLEVMENKNLLSDLAMNIGKMALNNSADIIADEVLNLME